MRLRAGKLVDDLIEGVDGYSGRCEKVAPDSRIEFFSEIYERRMVEEKARIAREIAQASRPGLGGAPSRATTLPTDSTERKGYPVASGVLDYFPDAIVAIARLSYLANEQHNSGQPMHWARSKSTNEEDTMMRHFLQRGTFDTDGTSHTAKMAWRALAILQKEIEGSR